MKRLQNSPEFSKKNRFFWKPNQFFARHFLEVICVVCPVAISEPFAISRGIRFLATHSLWRTSETPRDFTSHMVYCEGSTFAYQHGKSGLCGLITRFLQSTHWCRNLGQPSSQRIIQFSILLASFSGK